MRQTKIVLVLVAATMVALAGCNSNSSSEGESPEFDVDAKRTQPANAKPDRNAIVVAAAKFAAQSLSKKVAEMDAHYRGKWVRVHGKIARIRGENVSFETGHKYKDGQPVYVRMRVRDIAELHNVGAGQTVTIEGRYHMVGILGPTCHDCEVVRR